MSRTKLFVFDVNSLVSAFIVGSYANAKAFDKARNTGRIITSPLIQAELTDVFTRPKFDKYVSFESRITFLAYLDRQMLFWPGPYEQINACRDPDDNKYVELAVAASASCIITGDKALLALHPFRAIPILSATDFINQF